MVSRFDSGRPAPTGFVSACILLLAAGSIAAPAHAQTTCPADNCTPGSGPYPPNCPTVDKVVVCQKDVLNPDPNIPTDDAYQYETAIAAVAQGCDLALAGLWIDYGQKVAEPGRVHLAMSISWERGRHWFAPGTPEPGCPDPSPDPRRFWNDCYFAGCPDTGPPCTLLPEDCGYTLNPTTWSAAEPEICAGGNGYLYAVGSDQPVGGSPGELAVLFTRSVDRGETFGPFDAGGPGRRLKHVCSLDYNPDRCAIAASPKSGRNEVSVFQNEGHAKILIAHSSDKGATFSAPETLESVVSPEQVFAPAGAFDGTGTSADSGALYVAWTHVVDIPDGLTEIHLRSRNTAGVWSDIVSPSGAFTGYFQLGGGFLERSVPSVATDCTTDHNRRSGAALRMGLPRLRRSRCARRRLVTRQVGPVL